jgi:hypothetical protein
MEITAIIKPLYNDLIALEFGSLIGTNQFERIVNRLDLTELYASAYNKLNEKKDTYNFFDFLEKSEDKILGYFLNLMISKSHDFFFDKLTALLEYSLPLLPFVPYIEPIIEDLDSINMPTEHINRIKKTWKSKDLNIGEKATYFVTLLKTRARNKPVKEDYYFILRNDLIRYHRLNQYLPEFVKENNSLQEFWEFIKGKGGYKDREYYLDESFREFLSESKKLSSVLDSELLTKVEISINLSYINEHWHKSIVRLADDPEGAITSARTLIETVCKHILEHLNVVYDDSIDLPKLYKITASSLNLAPESHTNPIFKQILSGCFSVVEGLGSLRNKHSDAHGTNSKKLKPSSRHAELAVNLSGTMSKFLLETFLWKKLKDKS